MSRYAFAIALLGFHAFLTGCALDGSPDDDLPDVLDESEQAVSAQSGVDYSFARPSLSALHSEGYRFVVRYLSYDDPSTHGKILFSGEASSIRNAGLDLVSNWEYGPSDSLGGYNAGVADAKKAAQQAASAGAPPDRPIYFSVDFDATPGDQTAINAYLDGAASVLGRSRVGVYGGYYVVKRAFDAGKVKYGWQTYAWSGGQWDSRAQLRQVENGITAGNSNGCRDRDTTHAADFGQWSYHVQLVNVHSNKCLDVFRSATADNSTIDLWGCNGTGAQGYRITPHGKYWTLVNTHSGKCVDVHGSATANGSRIDLWSCNGTGAQLFSMRAVGGHTSFVNEHSGKCLEVKGFGTANGATIDLWDCNGGTNQQWAVKQQP